MPESAPLLVVQHQESCPPALFAGWLAEAGLTLDVRRGDLGDPLPERVSEHSGLLVLGGAMGAHDDATRPWLSPTKQLLRTAVAEQTPTLGICLGHQLAAVALGASSRPNPQGPTNGARPVGWCADAGDDPLVGDLSRSADVLVTHWNGDVVTDLPEAVGVLARTADGAPQILRFGDRAWGVQFHPEADHAVATRWAEEERGDEPTRGAAVDAALREVAQTEPRLLDSGRRLAHAFAAAVRAGR